MYGQALLGSFCHGSPQQRGFSEDTEVSEMIIVDCDDLCMCVCVCIYLVYLRVCVRTIYIHTHSFYFRLFSIDAPTLHVIQYSGGHNYNYANPKSMTNENIT